MCNDGYSGQFCDVCTNADVSNFSCQFHSGQEVNVEFILDIVYWWTFSIVWVHCEAICTSFLFRFVGLSNAFVTVGALLVYFLLPIAKWYLRLLMNAPANVANST
jgi:hypothetical protein